MKKDEGRIYSGRTDILEAIADCEIERPFAEALKRYNTPENKPNYRTREVNNFKNLQVSE